MELIEKHDSKGFQKYLDETDNTICGRNPILILLNVNKIFFSKYKFSLGYKTQCTCIEIKNEIREICSIQRLQKQKRHFC